MLTSRRVPAAPPVRILRGSLQMALGSASELEYHMILASDLEYLDPAIADEIIEKAQEVKRMLTSLIQKVRAPN